MRYQPQNNQDFQLKSPRDIKKPRKPYLIIFIALAIVIGLSFAYFLVFHKKSDDQKASSTSSKSSSETVRLIAVGDNIPHDTVNQQAKQDGNGTYNYAPIYALMKPFFDKADVRFCNVETVVGGQVLGISGYPTFNAPYEFAKDLHNLGCNIINTANNHVADKGLPGINNTREIWDTLQPLAISGANRSTTEQNTVSYFTKKNIKFAFVSFTEITNNKEIPSTSLNMFDPALVDKLLSEARANADFVIVSAHWGTEDSPDINASQEQWAKTFTDKGADVIIGTGPHVLQPVKEIPNSRGGKTLVWYSIGNFMSTQLSINELVSGIASMDITRENGKVVVKKIKFLPSYMHYEWTQAEAAAQALLARKNLKLYPLDQAAEPLARSQNHTKVQEQTDYVKNILNKYMHVDIATSRDF